MQFVGENDFNHLPRSVKDRFFIRRFSLKSRLKVYQLDVFFLSDSEKRGPGTIRAYVESFDFEKFSPEQRRTGGKYVSFCDLFVVCIFSFCN